jgi:hypothetical protein
MYSKLKILLVLLSGVFICGGANAYEVPTEVQKKNILLEVFTGIHCGNCPDGDVVVDQFYTAQPDILFPVDIHSGHYAVPGAGEPDYRVDAGEEIDLELNANGYGYPGGAISRRAYPEFQDESLYVIGRSHWTKNGKNIHQEDAPVNLWLRSVFDGTTRELKIQVEGYYTAEVDQTENFLNVLLIQDNIKGPQSGASLGNNYNHRHTLRAYITPTFGDLIQSPQKEDYFTREYTYTLPASIKNVPLVAEEIEVIVFVSAGKTDVLNVTGSKPEYINYNKPLAATLQAPKPPLTGRYGYNFFEAILKNNSDKTITTAGFDITVNGVTQTVEWTGDLPAFYEKPIRIDVSPYDIQEANQYSIRLVSLNETTVSGNSLSGSFFQPTESTTRIYVEIKTDDYADENRFLIKDADGNIVKELGPYPAGISEVYNDTIDLEFSKIYGFEVIDTWGDGVLSPRRGYYKLRKDDKALIAQNLNITTFGDKFFFRTASQSVVLLPSIRQAQTNTQVNYDKNTMELSFEATASGVATIAIYSVSGKLWQNYTVAVNAGKICRTSVPISSMPAGVYVLNISQQDKRESIKLVIE